MTGQWFYLGMNFNFPGQDGMGATTARALIPKLEQITGDRCTSRWPYHEHHGRVGMGRPAATADLIDIARATYVILVPLTKTARGAHVEMGVSFGLDKPVYLYKSHGRDPTAFDNLCLDFPEAWNAAVTEAISEAAVDSDGPQPF